MNLHELSRKGRKAWGCKVLQEGAAEGEEALFPMLFKLGVDIFDVVLIDQVIAFHDRFGGGGVFHGLRDLLLVMPGDLGIGDKEGRDQCIRLPTFLTEDALDAEAERIGKVFYLPPVMSKKDQTAFLFAGAFHHMQL